MVITKSWMKYEKHAECHAKNGDTNTGVDVINWLYPFALNY
ncbi:MAG: hypothetical protein JWO07_81 [Candidatus Saccharibacteria bacterium]|nr:hypothetical protein [Candidatus Saccharibacteria bacterium]